MTLATERRFHNMGDEIFFAEFLDVDFAALGQSMFRRHDKRELVFENFGGLQLRVAGNEGNSAKIQTIIDDFMGNIPGKHAMQAHLDAGMGFAEFRQCREAAHEWNSR